MADLLIPLLLVFFLVGAVLFGLLVHFLRGVEDPSVWTPPEHGPLEGRSLPWDRLRRERPAGGGGEGRRTLPWQQGQPARGRQASPAPAQRRVPQSRPAAPPPQRTAPSPQRPAAPPPGAPSPEGAPAARSEGEGVTLRRPTPAWLEQRQREAASPAAEAPPAPQREPQPPPVPPQRESQSQPGPSRREPQSPPAPPRRDRAPSRREPAPATPMQRGRKSAYAGLARLAGRPGRKAAGARPTFPWQQPKDDSPASAPPRPSPPRREPAERPAPLWSRGREEAPRPTPEPAQATPAQPREGRRCSTCGGSGTTVVRGPSGNLGRGPCPDCQ